MRTLAESLADVAHQSSQITHYSSLNNRPTGPFVSAYLYLTDPFSPSDPSSSSSVHNAVEKSSILHLIRDCHPSEARLFKFIGESDVNIPGGGGGNKRVEKREVEMATPLKEWKKVKERTEKGERVDEIQVMLTAAMKLVDDYRPMPRARAHIANLMDTHQRQKDRIEELERLIKEATNPSTAAPGAPTNSSQDSLPTISNTVHLSADEAIKAEEDALKTLESELLPLRRAVAAAAVAATFEENTDLLEGTRLESETFPSSTSATTVTTPGRLIARAPQTPGRAMPHVTNSLVNNATTPHRSTGTSVVPSTLSRFSPIRFLGTPRAPKAPSSLRRGGGVAEDNGGDEVQDGFGPGSGSRGDNARKRTIFGPSSAARLTMTPKTRLIAEEDEEESSKMGSGAIEVEKGLNSDMNVDQTDDTVKTNVNVPPGPIESTPARQGVFTMEHATPKALPPEVIQTPTESGPPRVEGVRVDLETIQPVIDKIWATMGDMMRSGLPEGKIVSTDATSSITHLYRLSQSDPTGPRSPTSTNSTLSTTFNSIPTPITRETIIFAQLFLLMLRSTSETDPEPSILFSEAKEQLGAMLRARKWESGGSDLGTKLIYSAVGKKVVKIDRRGGAGGVLRFAV